MHRFLLLSILFLFCGDLFSQILPRDFEFSAERMTPRIAPTKNLDYGYGFTVKNDSITVDLPYFGQVYRTTFNNPGLHFSEPIRDYRVIQKKKSEIHEILVRTQTFEYLFSLEVFSNRNAYLNVIPTHAQSIYYMGRWKDPIADARTKVKLKTTAGNIVLSLYNETPLHRNNFINKVKAKTFNGRSFNRVIKDFVVQCGEEQPVDIIPAEIHYPNLIHKRGALAMGRCTDDATHELKSADEQFYVVWGRYNSEAQLQRADSIMQAWSYGRCSMDSNVRNYYQSHPGLPTLDGSYTVFGEVIEGLDIIEKIQAAATDENDRPLKDIIIKKAKIIR